MSEKHFFEQQNYTTEYLLPYLKKYTDVFKKRIPKILDVGCAEGGTIHALNIEGYSADGIEISQSRVAIAKDKLSHPINITVGDITLIHDLSKLDKYDIIIMRDVIEHIDDKEAALTNIFSLLNDDGYLFVAFPLKYSAYAGHQQTSKTWFKFIFFVSLYPSYLIRFLCRLANEEKRLDGLLYIKKCALTFCDFKKIIRTKWEIHHLDFFISRPIYKQRFGWPIIKMINIPIIRELSNGCELLIKKANNKKP